jgi:Calcium-activated chloride channel
VAKYFDVAPQGGFMPVLSQNLFIIYGSTIATQVFAEAILPYILTRIALYREKGQVENSMISRPELEFVLGHCDTLNDNIKRYLKVTLMFGYTAMFVSALPLAATLAYISSLFMIQVDAVKLCNNFQRPIPYAAADIGTWQSVFTIMSVICVITNAAIIVFTMNILDDLSTPLRYW